MSFNWDTSVRGKVHEISEEQYEHMLNVLPPLYGSGCFAMGEPVSHTAEGVTYHWAAARNGRHFMCYGTRTEAERAFASGCTIEP